MHYYAHNISDFNNATRNLNWIQKYCYRELIELYYDKERPIKNDLEEIYFVLGADTLEMQEAIQIVLKYFFTLEDNFYRHERCDKELAIYKDKQTKQSIAGKASAAKRKALTDVKHSSNNRAPTNNQKLKTKNQFKKPSFSELVGYLQDRTSIPQVVAQEFLNYYNANGWKVGKNSMKCWKSAANGWLNRKREWEKENEESRRNKSKTKSDRNDQDLRALYN